MFCVCTSACFQSRQDYWGDTEKAAKSADAWRRGLDRSQASRSCGTSRGDGKGARRKAVPKNLTVSAAAGWVPKVRGCVLFDSTAEQRVRAFYASEGRRLSTSASYERYGIGDAVRWCLKWAWEVHCEATGESCPFILPDV